MAQILINWTTPLRWIFMAIDSILFGLIDACYTLIISFANAELFTTAQIAELRTKIYFVITLIAFFRLAFLLVNSLINPDKLTDENEGLSKVAFNFVIMLVLLVITPIIFNIALEFQKEIVNGNVITGIFSLSSSDGYTCSDTYTDKQLEINRNDYKTEEEYLNEKEHKKAAKCSSDKMKGIVISSLIYPDSRIASETQVADPADASKTITKYTVNDGVKCNNKCKDAVEAYNTMTADGYYDFLTLEKYIGKTAEIDDSEVFVYNYTIIITTICAGFIIYILLSFAFDLGKRLLELNLLMMLSPLFIATYVDPKSAKTGAFSKWLKKIGNTYVSLFLKLAALAVMLLFIKILSINKVGLQPIGPFGFIILLFAGLTFCKELPKWLGDLLGSEGGMGELGLGKKLGATPLLGGAAKKAGLMATGAAAGAATAMNARRREGRQRLKDERKNKGVSGISGLKKLGRDGIGSYAKDRMAARRDAVKAGGGLPKTLAQYGAAGILGAKSGGTTGIKADNIQGAFKGSVQTVRQTASGLGINGGDTFGQKIAGGFLSIENKMTDKVFGTFDKRDEKAKKIENDRAVGSFAASSNITESGYGKGKIAMSRKDKNSIAETTAFGPNDGVKSFEDYCASQYATTMYGEKTTIARNVDANGKTISYDITDTITGETVNVGTDKLKANMNGLVQGIGMQYMAQNWYGVQSQGISNYQHADAAAKSASQLLQTIESQVSGLTNAVKSSVSSMDAISDAVKTRMSNLDIKFDPSGKIQLDDANIAKLGKYVANVKGDPDLEPSEKEALLAPLAGFADEASRLTATISQKERAQAELVAAEAEAKKYEGIYITAEGVTAEEKIAKADKKASEAKGHIDASKPKDGK